MHICYLEIGYPHLHGGGGAGTYIQLTGHELVKRGHRVSVVARYCPDCPEITDDQGVIVYRPQFRAPVHWWVSRIPFLKTFALTVRSLEFGWKNFRFINQIHRSQPISFVEFAEGGDFWHAFQSPFPYIVHLHGSRYTFLRLSGGKATNSDRLHRQVEHFFIKKADWVFSPSHNLLSIVTQEIGKTLPHTMVLPYPVQELIQPKNALNQPVESPTVFFAARNDPVKGGENVLKCISQVLEKVPETRFKIFGYKLPNHSFPENQVVQYPFLPRQELLEYLQSAWVCLVPSRWDNSPYTVYEAMAAGKPVVATNVGGIPELVSHEKTGFLVEPDDVPAMARAIISLLTNSELRHQMGQLGKEKIRQIADLPGNVDQRLQIYQKVISK